jgi:hypothetical protein
MSIRDSIEAAVNTVETAQTAPDAPVVETTTPATPEAAAAPEKVEAQPKDEPKGGRTEGRARDEHGRLLPGKAEKKEAAAPAPQTTHVEPTPAAQRPPRPSSWKKEMWEHYDKLDPKVAEYVHQRESEFAKGVSGYKTDYDRAKPLMDAVAQYEPFLRQHNMSADQAVSKLFETDQTLRFGNPQQRLQTFARLAQDYQIPIHEMLVQGEDGKVYMNQQYMQPQTPAQQPQGLSPVQVQKMVQEQLAQQHWVSAIQNFVAAKDDKGNPKHPHFETVRQTMDGLLRAKLAPDLNTAYEKSLRMHDDIWAQEQAAKQATAQKAAQEAQARQVAKAKSTAASVRTVTPSGDTPAKTKGIRASVEAAVDAHSEVGRV